MVNLTGLRVAFAQGAVNYVISDNGGCNIVSSNQGIGRVYFWRHMTLGGARSTYTDDGSLGYIQHIANTAKQTQVGNCTEKSAVAFMYLYDKNRQVCRPLNWCSVGNGAHMFVVIGTISGKKSFINRPETWPDDTIVCDPWNEVVHTGKQWQANQNCASSSIVQEFFC